MNSGWRAKESEANGEWRIKSAEFYGYAKEKLDNMHADMIEAKKQYKIDQEKVDARIRFLEDKFHIFVGAVAILSMAAKALGII